MNKSRGFWNRFLILLCSCLIGTFLVSCSGNSNSAETESTPSDEEKEEVTITWSFWGDPWEVEINNKVKEAFEEKYPHIKVETQHAPWSNYFDRLQTQWAAGESPDVMFLTNVPSYASKGVLKDLTGLIEDEGFDVNQFTEAQLKNFEYDGKLYGLPRDNDTKVFFYNKKLFDEANLPYPEEGWTWNDLREYAKALTKEENGKVVQYGVAFEPAWWRLWVTSNGGEIFDDPVNPTTTTMNEPEAVEAIQFLADLMNEDKSAPSFDLQRDSSNVSQLFMTGQVAMVFGNHALIPNFMEAEDLEWDIVGMPRAEGKDPVNVAAGAGYVISENTEHLEEAFLLWSFLLGPEGQEIFTESGVLVPGSKEAQNSPVFLDKPYNAQVFIDETANGLNVTPLATQWPEAAQTFDSAFEEVWIGQKTAEEAINGVIPSINELLE